MTTISKPLVKNTNPELYVKHVGHMTKAAIHTYNYSAVDDYILQNWKVSTAKQIASDLNEYPTRINYRVTVLQAVGLIDRKNVTKRSKLLTQQKVLVTWLADINQELEA
tara:strand:+ start:242 stop:568 length:327 start_codon:yes stop_codon:yes gene_type:complete